VQAPDPFATLSFLSVVPELKLTDKGLVDVTQFKIGALFEMIRQTQDEGSGKRRNVEIRLSNSPQE
jgi:hypothetical protein